MEVNMECCNSATNARFAEGESKHWLDSAAPAQHCHLPSSSCIANGLNPGCPTQSYEGPNPSEKGFYNG